MIQQALLRNALCSFYSKRNVLERRTLKLINYDFDLFVIISAVIWEHNQNIHYVSYSYPLRAHIWPFNIKHMGK